MDTHGHTAIGRVIDGLYNNSAQRKKESDDTDPTPVSAPSFGTNDISECNILEDISNIRELSRQRILNELICSYRVEFGTNGNGDPTGYGYDILEASIGTRYANTLKLVVLYKNIHEKRRIYSYVNTITALAKRYKWFHETMSFVYQKYLSESDTGSCYTVFDSFSSDNLHHSRINYDPFDDALNDLINRPFYHIIGFDTWRHQMLLEAREMSTALYDDTKWTPWWTYKWKVRYVLKRLVKCITAHEEIEVTW